MRPLLIMNRIIYIFTRLLKTFFPVLLVLCSCLMAWADDFTVVIDAGHGGKDYGAVGAKTREKDVNLGVALLLGDMIKKEMKDVKVVYTRSKDVFVTLQGRAEIANKAQGDLFISIHTNSVDSKAKNRTTVNGASVYTLGIKKGEENLNVAKRENAVMMLEPDYSTTYQGFDPKSTESYIMFELSRDIHMEHSIKVANFIQKELVATAGRTNKGVRQAPFWVLVQTSMPSILIELDFICNPSSEKYLSSAEGQKALAKSIFNGFKKYKHSCDLEAQALRSENGYKVDTSKQRPRNSGVEISKDDDKAIKDNTEKKSETSTSHNNQKKLVYKVQILTYNKQLSEGSKFFKGLKDVSSYKDKGLYKYTWGNFSTRKEAEKALQEIKKEFSDAFVIPTSGGKRISFEEEKAILSGK